MAVSNTKSEPQIKAFKTPKSFEAWLSKNHQLDEGIYLQLFKKDSDTPSINYAEALDIALCYGWIDGIKKCYDEVSWLQKFAPRRAKSIWSKRNREHIERLIQEGKMQAQGIAEVEKAKADGRWEKTYDSPSNMITPEDFLTAIKKDKKAFAFFESLNKTNKYAIAFRLHSAQKPATRAKRLEEFVKMMKEGKKFYRSFLIACNCVIYFNIAILVAELSVFANG